MIIHQQWIVWTLSAVLLWSLCQADCDFTVDNRCFSLHNGMKTFLEAEVDCFSLHGRLAKVNDSQVLQALRQALGVTPSRFYWIGLTDETQQGQLLWMDEEPQTDESLIRNNRGPDRRDKNCIAQKSRFWHRFPCNRQLAYVCETGPTVPAARRSFEWSQWMSASTPRNGKREDERLVKLRAKFPSVCRMPYQIQCRTRGTNISYIDDVDTLQYACSIENGLLCVKNSRLKKTDCADYEVRVECPTDVNECEQGNQLCGDNAHCVNTAGSYKCVCNPGFVGDANLGCTGGKMCSAYGDPHYVTFDGVRYNFQGVCTYVMTRTCSYASLPAGSPAFQVWQSNIRRGSNRRVSFVKAAYVMVGDVSIYMFERTTRVNGVEIDPNRVISNAANNVTIEIRHVGGKVTQVITNFGLRINYRPSRLEVSVSDTYAGQLCGLCGNADGTGLNDLRASNGSVVDNAVVFVNSWTADTPENTNCASVDENEATRMCNATQQEEVQQRCAILKDTSGPFQSCHAHVDPTEFYTSCMFDMCAEPENPDLFCASLEMYVQQCQEREIMFRWRSVVNCEPTCSANEHFEDDASGCEGSCDNPEAFIGCAEPRTERCVCNENYVRSGTECIEQSQCGCTLENGNSRDYYAVGSVWYSNQCSVLHECAGDNAIRNEPNVQCHTKGSCLPRVNAPGEFDCVCNEGFGGRGNNCSDIDECSSGTHKCSPDGECQNMEGSYKCSCREGFSGNGYDCEDINECTQSIHKCSVYADCHNTAGSYRCVCHTGYEGDGLHCSEIPPDSSGAEENGCSFHRDVSCAVNVDHCEDVEGGFECHCPDGAIGNGLRGENNTGCRYPSCPADTITFGRYCLRVNDNDASFEDSRKACESMGGDLLTVNNAIDRNELDTKLEVTQLSGMYFVGIRANTPGGEFRSVDKTPLNTLAEDWAEGHPMANHDCVVVDADDKYKLKSTHCSTEHKSICKIPSATFQCPDGWKLIDRKCVAVISTAKSYIEATIDCSKFGGDLVFPNSELENEHLQERILSLLEQDHWMGLQQNVLALSDDVTGPEERAISFDNYNGGSLQNATFTSALDLSCFVMKPTGQWNGANCSEQLPYICQRPINQRYRCPESSAYFNGKCYKFSSSSGSSNDSIASCQLVGGQLISIASVGIQNFVSDHFRSNGLTGDYWIGLFEDKTNASDYEWMDGTEFQYNNWAVDEPSRRGPGDCVYIRSNGSRWFESDCSVARKSICRFEPRPCLNHSNCHSNGLCNMGQCKCKPGFQGDGKDRCGDILECSNPDICGENEVCIELPGSFNCACREGFSRNRFNTCQDNLLCQGDADCANRAVCFNSQCRCKIGYAGDAKVQCSDVDECASSGPGYNDTTLHNCHENADCLNTDGSFKCKCKLGFHGDGVEDCHRIPRTCDGLLKQHPEYRSGEYLVDPDGDGPLPLVLVYCDMRDDGTGITELRHSNQDYKKLGGDERVVVDVEYYISVLAISAVVDASPFCYQELWFYCMGHVNISNNIGYNDRNNQSHQRWGLSDTDGMCGCGELGMCRDRYAPCNCHHSRTKNYWEKDGGKVTDKSVLPITQVAVGPIRPQDSSAYTSKGEIQVGILKCGPKTFDIPKHCEDGRKNFDVRYNDVYLIDPDGADGSDEPFKAFCEVDKYYFGVTMIPHDKDPLSPPKHPNYGFGPLGDPSSPLSPGSTCLTYSAPSISAINKLKELSGACTQQVKLDCQEGAQLLNGGITLTTLDNRTLDYFGGGADGKCACGVLNTCVTPNASCNCDGSQNSTDFGFLRDKADLPVMCVSVPMNQPPQSAHLGVGPLMCAPQSFGLVPTCQEWRERGYEMNYAYQVDTDGGHSPSSSANLPESLVQCEMNKEPEYGVTIIPPTVNPRCVYSEVEGMCRHDVTYPLPMPVIRRIIAKAGYCTQTLKYKCRQLTTTLVPIWVTSGSGEGERGTPSLKYFEESSIESCNETTESSFDKRIVDKDVLPVTAFYIHANESEQEWMSEMEVGPLKCYDLQKTCNDVRENFRWTSETKWVYTWAYYLLDMDGPGPVAPGWVYCAGRVTVITPLVTSFYLTDDTEDNIGKKKVCKEIDYYYGVTPDQIRALKENSAFCQQYAKVECKNTPFTDYIEWYDIDGNARQGWAGNTDGDECACGEVNSCVGGPTTACNCDAELGEYVKDHGLFVNKTALPVSKICAGLNENAPTSGDRKLKFSLYSLRCAPHVIDVHPDCQSLRDDQKFDDYRQRYPVESEAWVIDPDQDGPVEPFTVFCNMSSDHSIGITEISLNDYTCQDTLTRDATTVELQYASANDDQLEALRAASSFCEQSVVYECDNAPIDLANSRGAYDANNSFINYWLGSKENPGCEAGNCACDETTGRHSMSGKFLDNLPLSKFELNAINGTRKLCVEPLKCYNVLRDCQAYKAANRFKEGHNIGSDKWSVGIDPDQAGGFEPFMATCSEIDHIMVTSVDVSEGIKTSGTEGRHEDFIYNLANTAQIHGLVNYSVFCSQDFEYKCKNSGIFVNNVTTLLDYQSNALTFWAGSDLSQTDGCACSVLHTCPTSAGGEGQGTSKCRCDAREDRMVHEGGRLINKGVLPLSGVQFGGTQGVAGIQLESLRCGLKPFDFPVDCHDAKSKGIDRDGEIYIMPNGVTSPFLVQCIKQASPFPITVIHPIQPNWDITRPEQNITYTSSVDQIRALMDEDMYCTQSIMVSCQNVNFSNTFDFSATNYNSVHSYLASKDDAFCTCGLSHQCATRSSDSPADVNSRQCNCDLADDVSGRRDVAVLMSKDELPVLTVRYNGLSGANGSLVPTGNRARVSPLFCAHKFLKTDECETGFHDCDVNARCVDQSNGFKCICNEGYNGLGGKTYLATGRSCPDDDECKLNKCPGVSTCENTPGSFICHCNPGYRSVAQTVCQDIDECAEGTHDCDKNAVCVNFAGSFKCKCKHGYLGSGRAGDCQRVGQCQCSGDPHCRSFDGKWLHYQGVCKYTMFRDNCQNGVIQGEPKIEIVLKNWARNRLSSKVSWAKELTVRLCSQEIGLKLGPKAVVNRQKQSVPYNFYSNESSDCSFNIDFYGRLMRLTTGVGVIVDIDGTALVRVTALQSEYGGNVCGQCGNFNDDESDDWILGPVCEGTGNITDKKTLFGESWRDDNPPDEDSMCQPQPCNEIPDEKVCEASVQMQANRACNNLYPKFEQCRREGYDISEFIDNCVYDYCHQDNEEGREAVICRTAEEIAAQCQSRVNVTIQWRNENFCKRECGENQEFKTCASPCIQTCNSQLNSSVCILSCVEMCVCIEGYIMDNGKCILPHQCGCVMEDGSYLQDGEQRTNANCSRLCTCRAATRQMECVDVGCNQQATCDFVNDDFGCHCLEGFEGDGENCTDIDECSSSELNNCHTNAHCNNTFGSYECECDEGYQGDGQTCVNINECNRDKPCDPVTEVCFDRTPGYECLCAEGYMRNETSGNCEDVDECTSNRNGCDRLSTNCQNTPGSYECNCKNGFVPNAANNLLCDDIDECQANPPPCHERANCQNIPGSYSCTCDAGFEGNGTYCEDIDECESGTVCQRQDATCENLIGSYQCLCTDGRPGCDGPNPCSNVTCPNLNERCYLGTCRCIVGFERGPNGTCNDRDECEQGQHACGAMNAECYNLEGSYMCQCLHGYRRNSDGYCDNIDECAENQHNCRYNSECVDTPGGYFCRCRAGFTGHCDECRDINECTTGHDCHPTLASCLNTPGSYECSCLPGFWGNGRSCVDQDECATGLHNCTSNKAFCVNDDGSFHCACEVGYELKSGTLNECTDENECLNSINDCDANARCVNTEGSYQCQCLNGYVGSGQVCLPDPYSTRCGDQVCHSFADCIEGACRCQDGFSGNGTDCYDEDECTMLRPCHAHATCFNFPGAYACRCRPEYRGNGYTCAPLNSTHDLCQSAVFCIDGECSDSVCNCPQELTLVGNKCKDLRCLQPNACITGAKCSVDAGTRALICTCPPGTVRSSDGTACEDINECELGKHECQGMSQCLNYMGGYLCRCPSLAFDVFNDGKVCIDVQPTCDLPCPVGKYCTNDTCVCLPGLDQSQNAQGEVTCIKAQTDCKEDTCPASSQCIERLVGFECDCPSGFAEVGTLTCEDRNECLLAEDTCDHDSEDCVNTIGTFTCQCKKNYELSINGTRCAYKQRCKCGPHGYCDLRGQCHCDEGYEDDSGYCTDIDECELSDACHIIATCTNTEGSHKCDCPQAHYGDGQNICIPDKCFTRDLVCNENEVCVNGLYGSYCELSQCPLGMVVYQGRCVSRTVLCANFTHCGDNAMCEVVDDKPTCVCIAGFVGDGQECMDYNECLHGQTCPENSFCVNKQPDFDCQCLNGFMKTREGSSTSNCTDINECRNSLSCHTNADCINRLGSYECRCKDGFIGNGKTSCEADATCSRFGNCHPNATCRMNGDIYTCQCNQGLRGDGVSFCEDENDCKVNGMVMCHARAYCVSRGNSTQFSCKCIDGYQGDGINICMDVDECAQTDTHECESPLYRCLNTEGSYRCECASQGIIRVDNKCEDINECEIPGMSRCSEKADCNNTVGSYTCQCQEGFEGDGVSCRDIDECAEGLDNCTGQSRCVNKMGEFLCICPQGYVSNKDDSCSQPDECSLAPDHPLAARCDPSATCTDQDNGYECTCPDGYLGDGFYCVPDSPCDKPGACPEHTRCSVENNTAVCGCTGDMQLVNNTCVYPEQKICGTENDTCNNETEICKEVAWGHVCLCKDNYKPAGKTCIGRDHCDPTTVDFIAGECISSGGTCENGPTGYTCICPNSTRNVNNSCEDIDECAESEGNNADCGNSTTCFNRDPGYECVCSEGYEKINEMCVDINECSEKTDLCEEICINTPGSFQCACPPGYELDKSGYQCVDINECQRNTSDCNENATCVNTEGSFVCACASGYELVDGQCVDINECLDKPCHGQADCTNKPGSFSCACKSGFAGDGIYRCFPVHPCPSDFHLICPRTTQCSREGNIDSCRCIFGYKKVGETCTNNSCIDECEDIDECQEDNCARNATCTNTDGGFQCSCPEHTWGHGFIGCHDINECAKENPCDESSSYCVNHDNTRGSVRYECRCVRGSAKASPNSDVCQPVNECSDSALNLCGNNSVCHDTAPSYYCTCNTGYEKAPDTVGQCVDINECALGRHHCLSEAECVNTPGSYFCRCPPFYELVTSGPLASRACRDIDECAANETAACTGEKLCRNTQGGFSCVCPEGYTEDAIGDCVDVDECRTPEDNNCKKEAVCENTPGSYTCRCEEGLRALPDGSCEEINECALELDKCREYNGNSSLCYNLPHGYGCTCGKGQERVPGHPDLCRDVDECTTSPAICGPDGRCRNTAGSYECDCPEGFTSTGSGASVRCEDVDECEEAANRNVSQCGPETAGLCRNTRGSFVCVCADGYEKDAEGVCVDVDECSLSPQSYQSLSCDPVSSECINEAGSARCRCRVGFVYNNETQQCEDMNECEVPNACLNGRCLNRIGSYVCLCNEGFRNIMGKCQDIDECAEQSDRCGDNGVCSNRIGSYLCRCMPGFENSGEAASGRCEPINECVRQNVTCPVNRECVDQHMGYVCRCRDGFEEDAQGICRDINECFIEDACHYQAICTNTDGSYTCECPHGYTGDGRTICESVCSFASCRRYEVCEVNENNQANCTCKCQGPQCRVQGPVCDSTGQTHASEKDLFETACRMNEVRSVNYFHECRVSCDYVTCPGDLTCSLQEVDGSSFPVCSCPACTEDERNSGPVCAENGVVFQNRCQFKMYLCLTKVSLTILYEGTCRRPIDCHVSEWTDWSHCSKTCGIGNKHRSRVILAEAKYNGKCDYQLTETVACSNGPCEGDCEEVTCSFGAVCDRGSCVCLPCGAHVLDPVCGRLETNNSQAGTYQSLCVLQYNACARRLPYTFINDGPCTREVPNEPLDCTVQRKFKEITDKYNCTSADVVAVNSCAGGCGTNPSFCCRAKDEETLNVGFNCPDGTSHYSKVTRIASCECVLEETTTRSVSPTHVSMP